MTMTMYVCPGAVGAVPVPTGGFPFAAPAAPPAPDDDDGPSAKRARTEDALEPEHSWLARHPGPVPLQVCMVESERRRFILVPDAYFKL